MTLINKGPLDDGETVKIKRKKETVEGNLNAPTVGLHLWHMSSLFLETVDIWLFKKIILCLVSVIFSKEVSEFSQVVKKESNSGKYVRFDKNSKNAVYFAEG